MNEVPEAGRIGSPIRSPAAAAADAEATLKCGSATSRDGLKAATMIEDREAARDGRTVDERTVEVKTITGSPVRSPAAAAADAEATLKCANATSRDGLRAAKTIGDREAARDDRTVEVRTSIGVLEIAMKSEDPRVAKW